MEPKIQTKGSAGADLHAAYRTVLWPGETKMIGTDYLYHVANPSMEATVRPRSSMSKKGLLVHLGTIDSDYVDNEVKVCVTNLNNDGCVIIEEGERIAQIVISPCCTKKFFETIDAERIGGFGSTGE